MLTLYVLERSIKLMIILESTPIFQLAVEFLFQPTQDSPVIKVCIDSVNCHLF